MDNTVERKIIEVLSELGCTECRSYPRDDAYVKAMQKLLALFNTHCQKRERLVRKEELDRLFTTKRINGDQIVNQATFNYILDRIGELDSAQLKQTSIKERGE